MIEKWYFSVSLEDPHVSVLTVTESKPGNTDSY